MLERDAADCNRKRHTRPHPTDPENAIDAVGILNDLADREWPTCPALRLRGSKPRPGRVKRRIPGYRRHLHHNPLVTFGQFVHLAAQGAMHLSSPMTRNDETTSRPAWVQALRRAQTIHHRGIVSRSHAVPQALPSFSTVLVQKLRRRWKAR